VLNHGLDRDDRPDGTSRPQWHCRLHHEDRRSACQWQAPGSRYRGLRPMGRPRRRALLARPVGHRPSRERRRGLGGPALGRRHVARTRGHHRDLVPRDRRLRRAELLRVAHGTGALEGQGQVFPGDPRPAPTRDGPERPEAGRL
jgi:hypothetical protein